MVDFTNGDGCLSEPEPLTEFMDTDSMLDSLKDELETSEGEGSEGARMSDEEEFKPDVVLVADDTPVAPDPLTLNLGTEEVPLLTILPKDRSLEFPVFKTVPATMKQACVRVPLEPVERRADFGSCSKELILPDEGEPATRATFVWRQGELRANTPSPIAAPDLAPRPLGPSFAGPARGAALPRDLGPALSAVAWPLPVSPRQEAPVPDSDHSYCSPGAARSSAIVVKGVRNVLSVLKPVQKNNFQSSNVLKSGGRFVNLKKPVAIAVRPTFRKKTLTRAAGGEGDIYSFLENAETFLRGPEPGLASPGWGKGRKNQQERERRGELAANVRRVRALLPLTQDPRKVGAMTRRTQ
jgi:hypothetical protein